MSEPVFLTLDQVKALHRLALDRHGGQDGVRDAATLESAVVSPAGTFACTYRGAGTLWTNLALPNSSRITSAFDAVGRLTQT